MLTRRHQWGDGYGTLKNNVSVSWFGMELSAIATEVILAHPHQSLGHLHLDWMPQPGAYFEFQGQTYAVLERRHRYELKRGKYQLRAIAVVVQRAQRLVEKSQVEGRWVIGDASCRLNARSELLRCAVNPNGPCGDCREYTPSPAIESHR